MENNRDRIELDGFVVEASSDFFKINVGSVDNPNIVSCKLSGKIRQNSIRILISDRVRVEVSAYDLTRGRIIYRYKGNERRTEDDFE